VHRSIGIVFTLALAILPQSPWAAEATGEEIYRQCAICHGAQGEGGKEGEYPRIGGLPQAYIERQLHHFNSGKRANKPMDPVLERQLADDAALTRIAAYVAQLPEFTPPPLVPSPEVLADFDSPEEFDELGEEIFVNSCAECHGDDGRGREDKEAPPLINRYPAYLRKQIEDFVAGHREHEHATKMFGELYPEEIDSLLVHLGRMAKED